jgi:hypothetical protein
MTKSNETLLGRLLERKGFPPKWIDQVMCTIQGGKVCVNVNGERSQHFRSFQGLRQGDSLSPILFNLVADVLGDLMRKAAKKNRIKGLMSHLIEEGITHIQYADDTILMIEGDDQSIVNMKFILYCFEWISGLRINYHNSEAYIFGMEDEEQARVANMLNCQVGSLPMVYLGIPVSDKKLGKGVFIGVIEKIAKRVPPWKGKLMSSGARLILSSSCLSSLPTYIMGFYLLPKGTPKAMDGVRSRFYWRGAGEDFKYHMINWQAVCRPKDFGGLGLINSRVFNECLMVKWIWKLYQQKESLWARLIHAKYMRDDDFYKTNGKKGSQFWKSLHKVKDLFKWGVVHRVGSGSRTHLCNDVWIKPSPLRVCFPKIFAACDDRDISVAKCARAG